MEKRILVTGIILTLCTTILIVVFFIYSKSKDGTNPLRVVPLDALVVLRLNGYEIPSTIIKNKSKLWNDISYFDFVNQINKELNYIDSLFPKHPRIFEAINHNNIYISAHPSGGTKLRFLTTIKLPNGLNERFLYNLLELLAPENNFALSERKYEGKTIYELNNKDKNKKLYFSIYNGLLLHSSSTILIEDAIRQSTLPVSLLNNNDFEKLMKATGKNKDANLFINMEHAGKLFSMTAKNELVSDSKKYKYFGGWAELDINLNEEVLLLNGFTFPNDSINSYINTISALEPIRIEADKVLPASTSFYISYGISSPDKYYKNYLNYLKTTGYYNTYQANLKVMNQKYNIEFDKFFLSLLDDEITLAHKTNSEGEYGSDYLLIKCKSGTDAEKELAILVNKIKNIKNEKLTFSYSPDNEIKHKIFRIPIYPFFGRLLGKFYDVFDDTYLTVVGNYIVVSESYKEASEFLYDYMLQKTLVNNEVYRSFTKNFSLKSYMLCYSDMTRSHTYLENYLKPDIIDNWQKHIPTFKKAQSFGIQVSEVSNLPYFNIMLQHYDNYLGKPRTIWESKLDTVLRFKPKFVTNHYNKQNEIVIQDAANNLYLLNQAGRILWKIRLSEKINSEIYQIDYFKNGKLQLAFSSKNHLHIIDRNGNYVERYPVQLRAESTAGMALFDYELNKNYRILIPCNDKKVYAYSKEGNIISGWNFKKSDHYVNQSPRHYKVDDRDFIIFGDKNYTYILDRKGNERIKCTESFVKSTNNTYYLNNTGSLETSYFLTTDTSGTIIKIFLTGQIERQNIEDLGQYHYFDFKDVDADGKSDYIFLNDSKISIYQSNGKKIFDEKFDEKINQPPVYYHFSYVDRKIGIVSEEKNKIYLLNNNGDTYKGFPLEGSTLFTIGYFDLTSNRFNLIVGGRNNFLYNYAVE